MKWLYAPFCTRGKRKNACSICALTQRKSSLKGEPLALYTRICKSLFSLSLPPPPPSPFSLSPPPSFPLPPTLSLSHSPHYFSLDLRCPSWTWVMPADQEPRHLLPWILSGSLSLPYLTLLLPGLRAQESEAGYQSVKYWLPDLPLLSPWILQPENRAASPSWRILI